ncbi:MAG: hypothetical protein Q4P23_15360, partial [Micrococcaceae bacterium]|nr:hypothetical protein [Micrococcaceae bacterium]
MDEIINVGLLRPDGSGGWLMPEMVCQVLTERAGMLGRERTAILEQAAVDAMASTHGVKAALESAFRLRRWPALMKLLSEHWPDLFMDSPHELAALVAAIPRFFIEQSDHMRASLRILGLAGEKRMLPQLPAVKPNYATDFLAQSLHRDTTRLYRTPNARAIRVGMLEVIQLRLVGLYEEAADSAMRLRSALGVVLSTQATEPSLAAFTELQAGMALHLADRGTETRQAYESSFHWAKVSGKSFMLADAAGKLGLLSALEGDTESSLRWVEEHEAALGAVGWGKEMLARPGAMARACLAADRLDIIALGAELATMPSTPDNDEFWAVHAYLLSLHRILSRSPAKAPALVHSLRVARRYAATAPLARQLLDDALLMDALLDRRGPRLAAEYCQGDPTLIALG